MSDRTREARFWGKVEKTESCWLWKAGKLPGGYGMFWLREVGNNVGAHRVAYELTYGPIPDGLVIDHLCRVRHCVNPAHMEPVSMRENVLRGVGKTANSARQAHCIHGHEFDTANTWVSKDGRHRHCKQCLRERAREYRSRA